jgi:hypothetical protein
MDRDFVFRFIAGVFRPGATGHHTPDQEKTAEPAKQGQKPFHLLPLSTRFLKKKTYHTKILKARFPDPLKTADACYTFSPVFFHGVICLLFV